MKGKRANSHVGVSGAAALLNSEEMNCEGVVRSPALIHLLGLAPGTATPEQLNSQGNK
jgi:hypothetical protein